MMRASMLLAGLSALALAAPALAQSHGSEHGTSHQGHAAQGDHSAHKAPTCTPDHAAMGHCNMEAEAGQGGHDAHQRQPGHQDHRSHQAPTAPANHDAHSDHGDHGAHSVHGAHSGQTAPPPVDPHPSHAMPAVSATPATPACTPDHAAMGHCTLDVATPGAADGKSGTDLPAGDAPAPPPPGDWYADRIFPKAAMEHSRHEMMVENGDQTFGFISANFEYLARKGHDSLAWDAEAWFGGDINRLTIKGEGESEIGEGFEGGEAQLLYSRAIGPYFNAQAGVRRDFGPGPDRSYATIGFEGLAPYWFEVEGALFLSDKGDAFARIEGEYDQRITQRLVLQPAIEADFALQGVPESGIGSGLSKAELGLRLRYEIIREFAPYVGVQWERKFGATADYARASGKAVETTAFIVGVRIWF
ncbi:copper resistance protein B [Sphingopyxis sp. MWB1]|uniref:copper resistance protein B n=1 Tax=Sphingopyxis sp. MWB1 TaxID=1537715 RepID=UPI00051A4B26|nr:copper resistance protein B [Sphingopyxis sp. MWB1]